MSLADDTRDSNAESVALAGHSVFNILSMEVKSFGSGIISDASGASSANALTEVSGQVFKNARDDTCVSIRPSQLECSDAGNFVRGLFIALS